MGTAQHQLKANTHLFLALHPEKIGHFAAQFGILKRVCMSVSNSAASSLTSAELRCTEQRPGTAQNYLWRRKRLVFLREMANFSFLFMLPLKGHRETHRAHSLSMIQAPTLLVLRVSQPPSPNPTVLIRHMAKSQACSVTLVLNCSLDGSPSFKAAAFHLRPTGEL